MNTQKRIGKKIVKSSKKSVSKGIDESFEELSVCGAIESEFAVQSSEPGVRAVGVAIATLTSGFEPFISDNYRDNLHDVPSHLVNDIEYIHFHIFSVWFLSKMNINIPVDLEEKFKNVQNFPFFSTLFHIRNNISEGDIR